MLNKFAAGMFLLLTALFFISSCSKGSPVDLSAENPFERVAMDFMDTRQIFGIDGEPASDVDLATVKYSEHQLLKLTPRPMVNLN
jgi:hypothetical protein